MAAYEYSKFNTFLFGVLAARTDGTPHQMVSNTEEGNGFEAWRCLNKEYNPLTGNSARAYMQAILAYTSVAKLELVSAKIAEFEEVCKHYAEHAGKDIDADVKVGKLFDILPKDTICRGDTIVVVIVFHSWIVCLISFIKFTLTANKNSDRDDRVRRRSSRRQRDTVTT